MNNTPYMGLYLGDILYWIIMQAEEYMSWSNRPGLMMAGQARSQDFQKGGYINNTFRKPHGAFL